MNNANTQIYDKVVDRAAMLRLYEARTSQKVELIIDGHALRVDKLVKESKLQGKDFNGFLKDLDDEIIKTMADSHNVSSRSLLDLFSDQVGYTSKTLNSAIGDIWRVQPPPRMIAEEIVLKRPLYNDVTLDQGWAGIGKQERIRLEGLIRKGIAEGQTNNAIADTLMKEGYKATKSQARGLVVTATTSVYAQADHQVYKANEKALQGYQYIAVLDSRTTPLCAHRDGNIYPITDTEHLPPAHWHCRSTTVPVVKNYEDFAKMEGIAEIRKRNFAALTPKEITQYDGQTPMRESYDQWLRRQPKEVQLRHLGDINKLELFRSGQVTLDKFSAPSGASVGIRELKQMTESGFGVPGDTRRFALAKEKLDTLKLGAARPEEIYESADMRKALEEYYRLQAGELDGTLSFTNYRGTLLHNKKNTRNRVLASPPREENLKFNPITGRYDDSRMYQPSPSTLANTYKLVQESEALKEVDKKFIIDFVDGLQDKIGVNERAVITDNLRITIGRFRENKEPWVNLKAVLNGQMKFDVMNVSSYMETQLRKDANLLLRLKQDNYIDPVLGPTQLQQLHDTFLKNIMLKNKWEDRTAITIGKELRNVLDYKLPFKIRNRLDDKALDQFYLRFAKRLGLADTPDRDQFAIALGRDLYNAANYRGSRNEWYKLGVKILDDAKDKGFYELETFGVQKRRMKSRMGGKYFGPYYDTFSVNIRIVDPRIVEYAKLTRKVDIGLRIGVTTDKNRLVIREGYKTYFIDNGLLGMVDTRIPITSTSSFGTFPASVIDKSMADALNWSAQAKYKIDPEFHDFVEKLLNFQDDKGKAQFYHDLNKYREFIVERGDAYERFKAMKWLRNKDAAFSNHSFLDHRGRIYERGFIGPQSGETFRPFLNTEDAKPLGEMGFLNFQDQIGSFLGGASDVLEDRYNSLSVIGRQQIAQLWRKDMVALGRNMLRGKPGDIRAVLESPLMAEIDGEEQGKLMRLALEMAKIDDYLRSRVGDFKTSGGLFHISTVPLKNLDFEPRVPDNFLVRNGYEDSITKRVSFAENIDDALKAMSMDLKGKTLYVYKAPAKTKFKKPNKSQVPDAEITSEKWVLEPVTVEPVGVIKVKDAIESPFKYKYGDNEAELYGWNWEKVIDTADPYSSTNLQNLKDYKTALALEQDASSSGAQIIALTTRNRQLAELSNVVPTNQKQRLYDEIAAATFNDPRFIELNKRLNLTEKDLRKAAKAQNMVTLYGAGERTGILNVEAKLGKALGKEEGILVVKAAERDAVLSEISARMARYQDLDPEMYSELKALRQDVKEIFNKGLSPGAEIMEQLYFLDSKTMDFVEKLSRDYNEVVTPDDFQSVAKIMSENLRSRVPILKSFTKYLGRLAEDFLLNAKPSDSAIDSEALLKTLILGAHKGGKPLPKWLTRILGIKNESIREKFLRRIPGYVPDSFTDQLLTGVRPPTRRRTGFKIGKYSIFSEDITKGVEIGLANKLDKTWTNVPWVNFDGVTLEQNFTQTFEEKLAYKDADGNWINNIIQVDQKTSPNWWEELRNKDNKINDIADVNKARTAYGVNGNHSNDAVIVKRFHLWGRKNNIQTSTVHDAFFTNVSDMLAGRRALREIYANAIENNSIEATLLEMRKRGLPKELYEKYLEEAKDIGLIPVVGRSVIDGKLMTEADILKKADILASVPERFKDNRYFYGIG